MIAQRLVRKVCPDCSQPVSGDLTDEEQDLARRYGVAPQVRAVGCALCEGTGYRGRVAVMETVLPTSTMRQLINEGAAIDTLRQEAARTGMRGLQEAALDLVRAGTTTLEDVDRTLGESSRVVKAATVPIHAPGEPDPIVTAAAVTATESRDDGPPETWDEIHVLLADDDAIVRQTVGALLRANGFVVCEAEDGVEALERMNSGEQLDLVVSDLHMPRLNGHDLIRLSRGSARTAGLPIVILTGEEDPETEARLIEEGADDYMRKPLDPVRFVARIKAVIRRAGG